MWCLNKGEVMNQEQKEVSRRDCLRAGGVLALAAVTFSGCKVPQPSERIERAPQATVSYVLKTPHSFYGKQVALKDISLEHTGDKSGVYLQKRGWGSAAESDLYLHMENHYSISDGEASLPGVVVTRELANNEVVYFSNMQESETFAKEHRLPKGVGSVLGVLRMSEETGKPYLEIKVYE